jgi:hypothetical protein
MVRGEVALRGLGAEDDHRHGRSPQHGLGDRTHQPPQPAVTAAGHAHVRAFALDEMVQQCGSRVALQTHLSRYPTAVGDGDGPDTGAEAPRQPLAIGQRAGCLL